MRMSQLLLRTQRDAPGDAETVSQQLLLRGGYVRRLASGSYVWLPLGRRVLRQLERIAREELDGIGGQELSFPAPPSDEQLVATIAAGLPSYRALPLVAYQVQAREIDEARPRHGLLQARDVWALDVWAFAASRPELATAYERVHEALDRILQRVGLRYTTVEATVAGPDGASAGPAEELVVASDHGDESFAHCAGCGYAATEDAATSGAVARAGAPGREPLAVHLTPGCTTIEAVVRHFADRGLDPADVLKCIACIDGQGKPMVALVPGDREVRIERLGPGVRPFVAADFEAHPGFVKGYISPMGLQKRGVRVVADPAVRREGSWVTGANMVDHHVTGATLGRDFDVDEWRPIAALAEGDPCPVCGQPLALRRSFRVARLGSSATPADKEALLSFVDEGGTGRTALAATAELGLSRLVALVAEQHHDDAGLVWGADIAPYRAHLVSLPTGADAAAVVAAADRLYDDLTAAGVSVLYDDRDASAGVKFADADLLGLPTQLVVGAKGLERGVAERKDRRTGSRTDVPLRQAAAV